MISRLHHNSALQFILCTLIFVLSISPLLAEPTPIGELNYLGKTTPEWIQALNEPDSDPLNGAYAKLSLKATPEAIPVLLELSKNSAARIRNVGVMGLSFLSGRQRADDTAQLVESFNEALVSATLLTTRYWAVSGLEKLGSASAKAVPALIENLKLDLKEATRFGDFNGETLHIMDVRRGAASALASIGPAAAPALPALKIAATDPDLGVRGAAKAAVDKLSQSAKN